jgi:arylsulfatase A-like enzyme
VNWPKRWTGGQRRTGACSLVDVVQTIAEMGGTKAPADWNGTSMVKWMDDPKARWKDLAVSQYYAHNIASGYAMIRMGPWKYTYHTAPDAQHAPERELYNLDTDAMEFRNLAADVSQKQRVQSMHAALVKELGEDPEESELRCRAENAKGYKGTV